MVFSDNAVQRIRANIPLIAKAAMEWGTPQFVAAQEIERLQDRLTNRRGLAGRRSSVH